MSINALRNAVPAANKVATILSSSTRRTAAPSSYSTAAAGAPVAPSAIGSSSSPKFPPPHLHHAPLSGSPKAPSSQPFYISPSVFSTTPGSSNPLSPTTAASFTAASPADSLALVQPAPNLNHLLAQLQIENGRFGPKRKLIEAQHHPRTEGDGIIRQVPAPFLRQPSMKRKMPKRVVVDVYCQLEGYLEQLRPLISPIMQKKFILDEYPVAVDHLPITPKAHGAILTLYSSTDRWKERLNNTLVDKLNELYANVCLVLLKPVSDPTGLAYISSKGNFLAIKQLCVSEEGVYDIPYNRSVLEEVLHLFERDDLEDPLEMSP